MSRLQFYQCPSCLTCWDVHFSQCSNHPNTCQFGGAFTDFHIINVRVDVCTCDSLVWPVGTCPLRKSVYGEVYDCYCCPYCWDQCLANI